ncbi:MAG TPA: single-stranded DNA-binding protein [Spirochaetia bacterium]|nr:single-stranded DNA-binding protein [Spirochaetia bacterium]
MADINHVVLVGRLTRNAELKYTNSGAAVSKFSIAINQRRKKDDQWVDESHFFDIVLWGKSAEAINQYLVKGKQVGVEGQLRQNRWEQEGQSRSKVEIFATNVMLLGGGGAGRQGGPGGPSGASGPEPRGGGTDFPEGAPPSSDNFEDDIPF